MNTLKLLIASSFFMSSVYAADDNALTIQVYNAGPSSFSVNSTLVFGDTEAVVIDAGFTKADALKIAANVLDSGKNLSTIFVSQADPDYYFGVETLKQIFPEAKVYATPAVRAVIEQKMENKLQVWAPKMGNNAPINPELPDEYTLSTFSVDGYEIEIKTSKGELAHRPYLWIPSQKAIVGNVAIFGNLQAWTADTQTVQQLDAWTTQLLEMKALNPELVIPGHMSPATYLDVSAIDYTLNYLKAFQEAKASSQSGQELIDKMLALYPSEQVPVALKIGAKVHMGEMAW